MCPRSRFVGRGMHVDALGPIRLITKDDVERAERRIYHPFATDYDLNTEDEARGWIGERYDAGAGLQYLGRTLLRPRARPSAGQGSAGASPDPLRSCSRIGPR